MPDLLRVFGPDDPNTLAARQYLARWRGAAGNPSGAVAALAEVVEHMLRVLGPDHRYTLTARRHLAHWRGMGGNTAVGESTD
jgi:hypothetical protein